MNERPCIFLAKFKGHKTTDNNERDKGRRNIGEKYCLSLERAERKFMVLPSCLFYRDCAEQSLHCCQPQYGHQRHFQYFQVAKKFCLFKMRTRQLSTGRFCCAENLRVIFLQQFDRELFTTIEKTLYR